MENDPMLPDAPLIALLSLDASPFIADMTLEQLTERLVAARALAAPTTTAPTITLNTTTKIKSARQPSKATKLKAFLDSI